MTNHCAAWYRQWIFASAGVSPVEYHISERHCVRMEVIAIKQYEGKAAGGEADYRFFPWILLEWGYATGEISVKNKK